jgi:hypothetical protein
MSWHNFLILIDSIWSPTPSTTIHPYRPNAILTTMHFVNPCRWCIFRNQIWTQVPLSLITGAFVSGYFGPVVCRHSISASSVDVNNVFDVPIPHLRIKPAICGIQQSRYTDLHSCSARQGKGPLSHIVSVETVRTKRGIRRMTCPQSKTSVSVPPRNVTCINPHSSISAFVWTYYKCNNSDGPEERSPWSDSANHARNGHSTNTLTGLHSMRRVAYVLLSALVRSHWSMSPVEPGLWSNGGKLGRAPSRSARDMCCLHCRDSRICKGEGPVEDAGEETVGCWRLAL